MNAETPKAPYYAVIFTSILSEQQDGYQLMAERMIELASAQSGFLGIESAREQAPFLFGITVSYWRDLESIKRWKQQSEHLLAQKMGKQQWYKNYRVRIAKVEKDYSL